MVNEINELYEARSKKLPTHGHSLVGQIKDEKLVKDIISEDHNSIFKMCFETYLTQLGKDRWDVRLENVWINEMFAGEYNPTHWHSSPKADLGLSSVLMLKRPDTYGKEVKPNDPTNGMLELTGGSQDPLGICNWKADLEVGDFLVFPFTMLHTAYPFNGTKQSRRTLSYNCDLVLKTMNPMPPQKTNPLFTPYKR